MIHAVVIDDEPPIADGIADLLRTMYPRKLTVKAYYSAQAVSRRLGTQPIDLVVADINMPGMTGLQLASHLRTHYPHVKVILLTGHRRFDYVYEANQLGGVRYILKTADDAAILEVVNCAVEEIEERRRHSAYAGRLEELARSAGPLVQRDLVERIVRSDAIGDPLGQDDVDAFGVALDVTRKVLLLVASGAGTASEDARLQLRQLLARALGDEAIMVLGEVDAWPGVAVAVVQPPEAPTVESSVLHDQWLAAIQDAHRACGDNCAGLNVVVNEAFVAFAALSAGARRLLSLCGFLYRGAGSVYTPEGALQARLDEGRTVRGVDAQAVARIESAFDGRNWDRYMYEVDRLLAAADDLICESVWAQHQYRLGLRFVCSTIISRLPRSPAVRRIEEDFILVSQADLPLTDIATEYRAFFRAVADLATDEPCESGRSHPVDLALAYMNEHLHGDLSVPAIAAHLSMSAGHFSRLFKSEMGKTVLEHVSDLRLDRARALLLNTNMRIQEIAGRVGLTSVDYFIRFFGRRTGMSPQQYRDAGGRE